MKIKLKGLFFTFLIFTATGLTAQSGLSRGEALFKENNAGDAVQVLEYEILNGQISDNTYNFLGLGYYQLGEYDKSLDAFKRGLKAQPENKKILSYNMGNTFYALKDYTSAITCYSDALKAEPLFYEALLNRANALLMAGQLVSAKDDYVDFVAKNPDDPQRERIELLIAALEEEIARREEEARMLAEQNKAKWEEYDGKIDERSKSEYRPYWEEIESQLADEKKSLDSIEWERILSDDPGAVNNGNEADALAQNEGDKNAADWEKFENEPAGEISSDVKRKTGADWEEFESEPESAIVAESALAAESAGEERIDDEEKWLSFSDEELDEMRALEEESRAEHERWLEDVRRREAESAALDAQARQKEQQQAYEDERRMREQLLEDMRKSEDERRKKLLEDVANSLQGTDSTNLTSGAEDLIDYDLEGELD